jgi:hypothetical protein
MGLYKIAKAGVAYYDAAMSFECATMVSLKYNIELLLNRSCMLSLVVPD